LEQVAVAKEDLGRRIHDGFKARRPKTSAKSTRKAVIVIHHRNIKIFTGHPSSFTVLGWLGRREAKNNYDRRFSLEKKLFSMGVVSRKFFDCRQEN